MRGRVVNWAFVLGGRFVKELCVGLGGFALCPLFLSIVGLKYVFAMGSVEVVVFSGTVASPSLFQEGLCFCHRLARFCL